MKTILYADDNQHIRQFCQQELEEEGYRVLVARDGKEAVELVRQLRPDVAILDIRMPVASGLDAGERIRAMDPQLPIIFFTANDDECLMDRRSRFAAACVEKCEDLTELKRAIVRLLASPKPAETYRTGLPPGVPGRPAWLDLLLGTRQSKREKEETSTEKE